MVQERGAYCKKRIFQVQKRAGIKEMLIHFSDVKKGLFPLIREFIAAKTVFISFSRNFIAMRTVVIPYEDGRHSNEDGRDGDDDHPRGNKAPEFPLNIWDAVRFILLQAILRKLRFITLPMFPPSGNQNVYFSEWYRHLISSVVSQEN